MKIAMTFLYLATLLYVVIQMLWNEKQIEYRENQLMLNARLLELNFDIVRRLKDLEKAAGIEHPPGKLKPIEGQLPQLPVYVPIEPENEPAFSWMFGRKVK